MKLDLGINRIHCATDLKNRTRDNINKPHQTTDITLLKMETDIYTVFIIHNWPYLVTDGDKIILSFKIK